MKEKDFEDLGKRLYEMEAEPPKKGWKRISGLIPRQPAGPTLAWLRKHGWIPLVLTVPILIYLLNPMRSGDAPLPDSASRLSGSTDSTTEPVVSALPQSDSSQIANRPGQSPEVRRPTGDRIKNDPAPDSETIEVRRRNSAPTALSKLNENEKANDTSTLDKERVNLTSPTRNTPNPGEVEAKIEFQPLNSERPEVHQNKTTVEEPAIPTLALAAIDSGVAETPAHTTILPSVEDSIAAGSKIKVTEKAKRDSTQSAVAPDQRDSSQTRNWYWTLTLTPQFVSQNVKPVQNDDVFITQFDHAQQLTPAGYSIEAGVTRALNQRLAIHAQLNYTRISQDVMYQTATGIVDTLLVTAGDNQTYRVSPVYQTQGREIRSDYSYAGVRIGILHYFLLRPKSRWSIMASSAFYLPVSANSSEKINGQWQALPSNELSGGNLSAVLGVGYHRTLARGWDLGFIPSLTQFFGDIRTQSAPYSLNQTLIGVSLQLMRSRP